MAHTCEHPEAPAGSVWRCPCGQLWQLSIAQDAWIIVSPESAAVLAAIFGELP